MNDFRYRSAVKEILDGDEIPFANIAANMNELNKINTLLGGHSITLDGVKALLSRDCKQNKILICEIGCGGGDNLNVISEWCKKENIDADFIGIDLKKECIQFATEKYPHLNAEWIISDYKDVIFKKNPHIIFSSLFCHHFTNEELQEMMKWKREHCITGFFINDLHRHFIAWFLIKWLTRIFSKSYLVKNDAPVSVTRGFKGKELAAILSRSGIKDYIIKWKWAFRYLITFKKIAE